MDGDHLESPAALQLGDLLVGHVLDVGVLVVQGVDLVLADIDADDDVTCLGGTDGDGKPDVAEPHHEYVAHSDAFSLMTSSMGLS